MKIYPVSNRFRVPVEDATPGSFVSGWSDGEVELFGGGTHIGFVNSGSALIETASGKFEMGVGMYFSVPGSCVIRGRGEGFVASRSGWIGHFQIGGPVESTGRLTYIDGCSDSLLVAPVVLGDPCLNLLYLPRGTTQTDHTHPSCRVGIIASGSGVCRTPYEEFSLSPGCMFEIAPDAVHSFHTDLESLRVIAWHPDSDFGPTHRDHPMINRTMIDGTSAARLILPVANAEAAE